MRPKEGEFSNLKIFKCIETRSKFCHTKDCFEKKDLGKTSNFKKIFAVRYPLNYSTTLGQRLSKC